MVGSPPGWIWEDLQLSPSILHMLWTALPICLPISMTPTMQTDIPIFPCRLKGQYLTSALMGRGVYWHDTPQKKEFSQHTNIFGILTDCIPPSQQTAVMQQVLKNSSLVQTTIYYRFYLFEAMYKSGFGDDYLQMLGPWKEMIDKGLTTWEEGDYDERSDCHAWGASPNYHLLSIVCGINPGLPGFREILLTPHLGNLKHVKANMPHPKGTIKMEYFHNPGKKLEAHIELPPATYGKIVWKGQIHELSPGSQQITLLEP